MLDALEPIDFREAAELDDDNERLSQKHYIVITVREVLRVARTPFQHSGIRSLEFT